MISWEIFIGWVGLVRSKNYFIQLRLIIKIAYEWDTTGWNSFGDIGRKGLEEGFWEQGLPSCIQSPLEYLHRWSFHNPLWQFIPVRDYSNAERILAATGFTPLLVNLQSMTAKPKAGGGSKNSVTWKVEKVVHYFVPADKVATDSSTD